MTHGRAKIVLRSVALGAVLLPLLVIWLPEIRFNYVPAARLSDAVVQAALGGVNAERCSRFATHDLSALAEASPDELLSGVATLQTGTVRLPRLSPISFDPTFSPADLSGGTPSLHTASLVIADLMLTAWRKTSDPRYLESADRYIRGWWNHESSSWFPIGLQWNDHAVASRVFVLSRYICAIKEANLDTESAGIALSAIVESGERLTKSDYFTFRTNHGVMQNIALMHIAAMYPQLPQSRRFADLGARRFAEQLDVYLSPEGAVNEHSAGYHAFGVRLMGMALDYFRALGLSPPPPLEARYNKALVLLEYLRRPNGTLPAWGNTVRAAPGLPPAGATNAGDHPSQSTRTWWGPISGLTVWWQGERTAPDRSPISQTVVTWSSFATRAHRHLDEMAVFIWTAQSDVLIGSGYWPYDADAGEEATGWAGANAPRLVGEPPSPPGGTRLMYFVSSTWLDGIELERSTPRGDRLRRQIFFLRPDRWIIIDMAANSVAQEFETSWLLDPNLLSTSVGRSSLRLTSGGTDLGLVQLSGCAGGSWNVAKASTVPFAGWTAADGVVRPTEAILRRCPINQPMILTLTLGEGGQRAGEIDVSVRDATHWEVRVAGSAQPLLLRSGAGLSGSTPTCGGACPNLMLESPKDDIHAQARAIDKAYLDLGAKYRRYRESWLPYRVKVTKAVGALWLAVTAALVVVWFSFRRIDLRLELLTTAAPVALWLFVAAWLRFVYFK